MVRVTTIRGTSRVACSLPIRLDESPPTTGLAIEAAPAQAGESTVESAIQFAAAAPGANIDVFDADATASHSLTLSWKGFNDSHSAFEGNRLQYEYCVERENGPMCGELAWTPAGLGTGSTATSPLLLALHNGMRYVARIRGYNRAGLYAEAVTDGVLIDRTPPAVLSSHLADVSVEASGDVAAPAPDSVPGPGTPRAVRLSIGRLTDASDFSDTRPVDTLRAAVVAAAATGAEAEHRFVANAALAAAMVPSPAVDASGIIRYEVAWGTAPGEADVEPWNTLWEAESVGRIDSRLAPGRVPTAADIPSQRDLVALAPESVVDMLVPGAKVYASFRVWNGAGLSTVASAASIGLDSTPPRSCVIVQDGGAVTSRSRFQIAVRCTEPESALASGLVRVAPGHSTQVPGGQGALRDSLVSIQDAAAPGGASGSVIRFGVLWTSTLSASAGLVHGSKARVCVLIRNAAGLAASDWACKNVVIDETSPSVFDLVGEAPANNDSIGVTCLQFQPFEFGSSAPPSSAPSPTTSVTPSATPSQDPCSFAESADGNCTRASSSPTPSSSASPSVSASPTPGLQWLVGPNGGTFGVSSFGTRGPSLFLRWTASQEDIGQLLRYDLRIVGYVPMNAGGDGEQWGLASPGIPQSVRHDSVWADGYGGVPSNVHAGWVSLLLQHGVNSSGSLSP